MGKEQVDWYPMLLNSYHVTRTDVSFILTYGFLFNGDGHFTQDSVRKRNQRHSLGIL